MSIKKNSKKYLLAVALLLVGRCMKENERSTAYNFNFFFQQCSFHACTLNVHFMEKLKKNHSSEKALSGKIIFL